MSCNSRVLFLRRCVRRTGGTVRRADAPVSVGGDMQRGWPRKRTGAQHFMHFAAEPRQLLALKRAIALTSRRVAVGQVRGKPRRAASIHLGAAAHRAFGPQQFMQRRHGASQATIVQRRHATSQALQCALLLQQEPGSCTGVIKAIRTFPKRRPFVTNLLLGAGLYGAADLCVQSAEGEIDERRLLSFACFGLVNSYVGWHVYVRLFTRLAPTSLRFANLSFAEKLRDRQGQVDVIKQVLLDNFVYTPFVFFPFYYFCKTAIQSEDEGRRPDVLARTVNASYRHNFVEDNLASLRIWLCADMLVFTVPTWMRMPVLQSVNFGFMMVVSHMRGSSNVAVAELATMPENDSNCNHSLPHWLSSTHAKLMASLAQLTPSDTVTSALAWPISFL